MGSYAYTCAVSGLPIQAGDRVRFLLLTRNPYNERACTMHADWFPRTFPLKAAYNDYGSVEDVQEGPERDVWLEAFRHDLVEVGVGDNTCHDVAATKDMCFGDMLEALHEGRVQVQREFSLQTNLLQTLQSIRGTPVEFPTLQHVSAALEAAGLHVETAGHGNGSSFFVDEEAWGSVRVRMAAYGSREEHIAALTWAQVALSERYATMLTAGSGNYASPAELLVRPLPIEVPHMPILKGGWAVENTPLDVDYAMIREDVWQALCRQPLPLDFGDQPRSVSEIAVDARLLWEQTATRVRAQVKREQVIGTIPIEGLLGLSRVIPDHMYFSDDENLIAAYCTRKVIPYSVGLDAHWRLMLNKHVNEALPEEQVSSFLQTVAETVWVHRALMAVRYQWRPSGSAGPQCGEWELHERVLRAFADIAGQKLAEQRAENDDNDDDV